jgi:hypothetical protein
MNWKRVDEKISPRGTQATLGSMATCNVATMHGAKCTMDALVEKNFEVLAWQSILSSVDLTRATRVASVVFYIYGVSLPCHMFCTYMWLSRDKPHVYCSCGVTLSHQ